MAKKQKTLIGAVLSTSNSGEGFVKVKIIVEPEPNLAIRTEKFMVPIDFNPGKGDIFSLEDYVSQGGFTEGTCRLVSRYAAPAAGAASDSEEAPV